jgi:hypothetical protein
LTEIKECLQLVSTMDLEAPELVQRMEIPPSSPPIPHLALYFDGIVCRLCESQPYVCRSEATSKAHLKEIHGWTSGEKGGRPSKFSKVTRAVSETSFSKVTTSPVACQTFYRSNFFRFFVVQPVKDTRLLNTGATPGGDTTNLVPFSLEDQIALQLAQNFSATVPSLPRHDRHYTQVSP